MPDNQYTTVLDSLPDRPLSIEEADVLANSEPEDAIIAPLTVMAIDGETSCVTLSIAREKAEMTYLMGYSPSEGGWIQIQSWTNEEWTIEKQDTAVEKWVSANFHEGAEHSFLEVD
ncbi:hypothetical protein [Halosimplex halobium]|uniref:hypothetical protein n=1 Tax=Halosimplex halobium TaxID=3396618 RepID=UPI003F56F73D